VKTCRQCTVQEAMELIRDGDSIMVGGFGLVGSPLTLIDGLVESNKRNLTIISNNFGEQGKGLGKLLFQKQVKKAIGSFFTSNIDVIHAWKNGEIELELLPQGSLSEAIRAGGAGIAGFYVPASAGTELGIGKEERIFDGRPYVFERPLKADVALIKAHIADRSGNLVYEKSARNFNPVMATAARLVIAEVEKIVDTGELSPEVIVTPNIYVDCIVVSRGG